jgi:C-terminal processing protease CtpA/Prc
MQGRSPATRAYNFAPVVIVAIALYFSSCATAFREDYNPADKIAPEKLQQDAILLRKILEANHPSLYWYTPKDSMDIYFDEATTSITSPLTELQFRNKIAWLLAKIRCGHTTVRTSKDYTKYYSQHKRPQFPLGIKAWADTLVVVSNAIKSDTVLKRGMLITGINGFTNKAITDSIFQFIGTDGFAENFKYQLASFNFPLFYTLVFGLKDSNFVTYKDASGIEKTAIVQNVVPTQNPGRNRSVNITPFPKPTRRQQKAARKTNNGPLTFDSTNTAYLRLTSFSGAGLRKLFRNSFETIQQRNATNLVIDLRENGGGNIGISANLTRYLIQHPFSIADTVAAINRNFVYHKYIQHAWLYHALMLFTSKKKRDGKFHFGYLEHHVYQPKKDLHFNGHVYIIQGGFTFSAASMFVSHLKGQPNVTVVGEETGGGNYGNSSVFLPTVILPNTRIEITMPVYRIVNNAHYVKDGRGIFPDVFIGPSVDAIKNGVDIKMQKVRELIEAQNNKR